MRKNNPDHVDLGVQSKRCVIRRLGYLCQKCGSAKAPQVHHIIPVAAGGTNDESNLGLLCRACHADWHYRVESEDNTEVNLGKYRTWLMIPPTWFMISLIERYGYSKTLEESIELYQNVISVRRAELAKERTDPEVDYDFFLGELKKFEGKTGANAIKLGLDRAREQGKRLGRPPVDDAVIGRIRDALGKGHGIHATAKLIGCGVGTVQKVKREAV